MLFSVYIALEAPESMSAPSNNTNTNTNEYICISCWTSFVTAESGPLVTCPHCSFEQPVANDHLSSEETSDQEEVSAEQTPDASDTTAPDAAAEWTDDSASDMSAPPGGLEPISFDDLDDLETLLSNPDNTEAADEAIKKVRAEQTAAATAETEQQSAEETAEPAAEPEDSATSAWRFKSDSGLTYSFYSIESLLRWAEGLDTQSKALVTNDGVMWKAFSEFSEQMNSADDASAAFQNTKQPLQAAPEPAAPISTGQHRRETKTLKTASPRAKGPRSESETSKRRRPSGVRGPARNKARDKQRGTGTKAAAGPAQAISKGVAAGLFFGGMILGALAVYFGMYFLNFYDLAF